MRARRPFEVHDYTGRRTRYDSGIRAGGRARRAMAAMVAGMGRSRTSCLDLASYDSKERGCHEGEEKEASRFRMVVTWNAF